MKTITIFSSRVFLLIGFFLASVLHVFAQCGSSATVPADFATWNWEEPERDPGAPTIIRAPYCNTWEASVATGTSVTKYAMGAPWITPGTPALQQIGLKEDYKRSGGWELMKMDFGGRGNTPIPYFVLYNKPTGVLRVYAYIVNTNLLSGIVFTMSHSPNDRLNSGHSTSLVSLAQPYVVAPDKYASQPSMDSEVLTYVSFFGGPQKWAMGQFTMLFDPNTASSAFNLSSYQFQIHGLVSSDVKLNGSFQFKTNTSEDSDFSFGGPASKASADTSPGADPSALKILATGQKFLGDVSSVATKLQDINKKASDFTALMTNNPPSALKGASDANNRVKTMANSQNVTGGQALNGLTNLLGQFGGWFSLAGSVISVFSDLTGDGSSKSSFIPTVSKGTITMDGTITTKSALVTFYMMAPGTNHYATGSTTTPSGLTSTLPYYNCPLGIFNIQTTPVLQKVDYHRNTGVYYANGGYTTSPFPYTYPEDNPAYTSYMLTNNVRPIVNAASGLEIVSVKFAIAQKIPFSQLLRPYDDQFPFVCTSCYKRVYNFTYAQVSKGVLEAYPLDPGTSASDATMILQTPFMDAGCVGTTVAIPFNIPTPNQSNPVFLRVIAELKKVGAPEGAAHTYFSQDYAVDLVDDPNSASYNSSTATFNDPGPYHVEHFNAYTPYSTVPNDFYEPNIVQSATSYTYSYGSTYLSEIANSTLLFTSGTTTTILPNSSLPVLFHAARSIGIEGQLSVPSGASFVMSTDFKSPMPASGWYACDYLPSNYAVANQQCSFDLTANRTVQAQATSPTSADELSQLTVAPNPATGSTVVHLRVKEKECIQQLSLANAAGQSLWHKDYECTNAITTEIPLATLPQGIYIVRAVTSGRTYSAKLSVQ